MPGSARLRDCEILRKITSKQVEEKRLYGAICAAPAVVLEPWGLMKRKKVFSYPCLLLLPECGGGVRGMVKHQNRKLFSY